MTYPLVLENDGDYYVALPLTGERARFTQMALQATTRGLEDHMQSQASRIDKKGGALEDEYGPVLHRLRELAAWWNPKGNADPPAGAVSATWECETEVVEPTLDLLRLAKPQIEEMLRKYEGVERIIVPIDSRREMVLSIEWDGDVPTSDNSLVAAFLAGMER